MDEAGSRLAAPTVQDFSCYSDRDPCMTTSPIYLTEADVGRLVTVKDAIATLEELFATWK